MCPAVRRRPRPFSDCSPTSSPASKPDGAAKLKVRIWMRTCPMKKITIDPVSRIEGHARITIHLNDDGKVASTQFHVTQVRGFEKFTEGRPFYEMPGITARICGICPISHLLASSKACDAIMAVRIPKTGGDAARTAALRPDHPVARAELLLSVVARPAAGLRFRSGASQRAGRDREASGAGARRHRAAQSSASTLSKALAKERIHPSWIVPGGVNAPLAGGRPRPDPP